MRIRFTSNVRVGDIEYTAGQVVELSNDLAVSLIQSGWARRAAEMKVEEAKPVAHATEGRQGTAEKTAKAVREIRK